MGAAHAGHRGWRAERGERDTEVGGPHGARLGGQLRGEAHTGRLGLLGAGRELHR